MGEHQLRSSGEPLERFTAIFSTLDRSRSSGTLSEPSGWIIATMIHIRFLDPVRRPNRGPMPGIFIPESSSRNHDLPQASLRFKPPVACCLLGTEVPSLIRSLRINSATCDLDGVRTCECPASSSAPLVETRRLPVQFACRFGHAWGAFRSQRVATVVPFECDRLAFNPDPPIGVRVTAGVARRETSGVSLLRSRFLLRRKGLSASPCCRGLDDHVVLERDCSIHVPSWSEHDAPDPA